jgi:predicted outer membrane protein
VNGVMTQTLPLFKIVEPGNSYFHVEIIDAKQQLRAEDDQTADDEANRQKKQAVETTVLPPTEN